MSREAFLSNPDLQMVKAVGMLTRVQPPSVRTTPRPAAATAETAR